MLEFIKITDFPRGTLYDILKDAYSYDSRNNTAKEYVDLLGTYSEIEEEAFTDTAARQIVIPASVERIGDRAFQNSSELQIVIIPDTVLQIGNDAFSECDNVVIITSEGSTAEEYAIENSIPYVTENSFNNTETTLHY